MIEINEKMYDEIASLLLNEIGDADYFNGTVEYDTEEFYSSLICSLIICNLRKIVKNSIQGPSLFKRISSGITAFLFILCVLVFYTLYKIVSFLDSVVKLKACYALLTYNEERPYGGTSKA